MQGAELCTRDYVGDGNTPIVRTVGPIFMLYDSNDVFLCKKVLFEVRSMDDVIWETYILNPPPTHTHKVGVNRQFQAKNAKIYYTAHLASI